MTPASRSRGIRSTRFRSHQGDGDGSPVDHRGRRVRDRSHWPSVRRRTGRGDLTGSRYQPDLRRGWQHGRDVAERLHRDLQSRNGARISGRTVIAICECDRHGQFRDHEPANGASERHPEPGPVLSRAGSRWCRGRAASASGSRRHDRRDQHERQRGQGRARQFDGHSRMQRRINAVQPRAVGTHRRSHRLWQRELLRRGGCRAWSHRHGRRPPREWRLHRHR